jgi:hypothetical protein
MKREPGTRSLSRRSDPLFGLVVARAPGYDLGLGMTHQPLHLGTLAAVPDLIDAPLGWRPL